FNDIMSDQKFVKKVSPFTPKYLPATGSKNGILIANYKQLVSFLGKQTSRQGKSKIQRLYSTVLDYLSVVQIVVMDPTDGPAIFDSLNSKQEPMTIGDLVRNDIFSRIVNKRPADI